MRHLPEGTHSLAPRPGSLARLAFQIGRRGETCTPKAVRVWAESVCCSRLTTRRSAPRDLHPEGSAILSRWGLLFPLRPGAVKLVGMKGLAPPRLPDSESGSSSIRVKPHAQLEMALPAGISPATWRFEAARSNSLSYGSMSWGRRGDSHSRGADLPGSLRNCCCRC